MIELWSKNYDARHNTNRKSDIVFIVIIYCNRTTTIRHFFVCACVVIMTRLSPWEIFKVCTVYFILFFSFARHVGKKLPSANPFQLPFSPALDYRYSRGVRGAHAQSSMYPSLTSLHAKIWSCVCICYARELSHFGHHEGRVVHFLPANAADTVASHHKKKPARTAKIKWNPWLKHIEHRKELRGRKDLYMSFGKGSRDFAWPREQFQLPYKLTNAHKRQSDNSVYKLYRLWLRALLTLQQVLFP